MRSYSDEMIHSLKDVYCFSHTQIESVHYKQMPIRIKLLFHTPKSIQWKNLFSFGCVPLISIHRMDYGFIQTYYIQILENNQRPKRINHTSFLLFPVQRQNDDRLLWWNQAHVPAECVAHVNRNCEVICKVFRICI